MSSYGPNDLPVRQGAAPRVEPGPPQHQIEQLPDVAGWTAMRQMTLAWADVEVAPSMRAEPGTIGLFVPEHDARSPEEQSFLIGREFAHHHPDTDGGLHMVLPTAWHRIAIERGWAIPHTWAGRPTVSPRSVLVYAPRDAQEFDVVDRLIAAAERLARGIES